MIGKIEMKTFLQGVCPVRWLSVASHDRSVGGDRLTTVGVEEVDVELGRLVPVGVGVRNEHPRMADGEEFFKEVA